VHDNSNLIQVDFDTQPIFEIASTVLVALLYSELKDTDADRSHALTILCARALHMRAQQDPGWVHAAAPSKLCYAMTSVDEINRALKDINRRLRRRWVAGTMALPFLEIAATGHCAIAQDQRGKTTVNHLASRVLGNAPECSPEDVKKRIWGPSKPVLHLAAAFSFERYVRAQRKEEFDFDDFFWSPEFVARIIVAADLYRPLLEKAIKPGKLKLDPATLIRIIIAEPKSMAA
jgi:hypothetical protein